MKKLLVLTILCLAFTGCGSKETNTNNIALETETTVTETEINEIVTEETEVTESENISENETTQEVDLYSEFALSGNVTKNSDGTYEMSDSWKNTVLESYDGWFSNATNKDLYKLLNIIVAMYGEDATGEEVFDALGMYKTGTGGHSSIGETTGSINESKPSNEKPQGNSNSGGGNTGNSGGNSSSSNGGRGQQQEQPPAEEVTGSMDHLFPSEGGHNRLEDGEIDIPDGMVITPNSPSGGYQEQPPVEEDHGTIDFGALEQQGSNLEDGEIDIPDGIVIQ